MTSIDSYKKVEGRLDEQYKNIQFEIEEAQSVAKALSDGAKILLALLSSSEMPKVLSASLLNQDSLIIRLADIANQPTRDDGWTVMSKAAQLLKQHAPADLALLHKGTEHKSLKALMLKTGMFEFLEEKTEKGGTRVLYKLKFGHEPHVNNSV